MNYANQGGTAQGFLADASLFFSENVADSETVGVTKKSEETGSTP